MTTLAIIPARGGSKGIPGKNLIGLNGRPLIDYTLTAAQSASSIDQIFISTDDDDISNYCISKNISVPYQRPSHLATDSSGMLEVVLDALAWLVEHENTHPDTVILLQPTSPLRNAQDIDEALSLMKTSNVESLVSVHEMTEHPFECIQEENGGWHHLAGASDGLIRRQDYTGNYYFINGAIYAVTPDFLKSQKAFMKSGSQTVLYPMSSHRGIDIDTFEDLYRAEAYLSHPKLCLSN